MPLSNEYLWLERVGDEAKWGHLCYFQHLNFGSQLGCNLYIHVGAVYMQASSSTARVKGRALFVVYAVMFELLVLPPYFILSIPGYKYAHLEPMAPRGWQWLRHLMHFRGMQLCNAVIPTATLSLIVSIFISLRFRPLFTVGERRTQTAPVPAQSIPMNHRKRHCDCHGDHNAHIHAHAAIFEKKVVHRQALPHHSRKIYHQQA